MSVSEPPLRLSVHNLEELVGLVPYLLGFRPAESLVLLVMQGDHVPLTARVDLADVAQPLALEHLFSRVFTRFPGAIGWCLAFTDDDLLGWQVLDECTELLGPRLARAVQVGAAFWRPDAAGEPAVPLSLDASRIAATATSLGLQARASRAELAECITGPPDGEISDLIGLFDEAEDELAARSPASRQRLLRTLLRAGRLDRREAVRLAALVAEPEAARYVLGRLNRQVAEQQLALWTQVVRHSLLVYQVNPLGLLAMSAWQQGDGALQVICLERLDWLEPNGPMRWLLDVVNQEVLPPAAWPAVRKMLLEVYSCWPTSQPTR